MAGQGGFMAILKHLGLVLLVGVVWSQTFTFVVRSGYLGSILRVKLEAREEYKSYYGLMDLRQRACKSVAIGDGLFVETLIHNLGADVCPIVIPRPSRSHLLQVLEIASRNTQEKIWLQASPTFWSNYQPTSLSVGPKPSLDLWRAQERGWKIFPSKILNTFFTTVKIALSPKRRDNIESYARLKVLAPLDFVDFTAFMSASLQKRLLSGQLVMVSDTREQDLSQNLSIQKKWKALLDEERILPISDILEDQR
jgi:hypothetical protein